MIACIGVWGINLFKTAGYQYDDFTRFVILQIVCTKSLSLADGYFSFCTEDIMSWFVPGEDCSLFVRRLDRGVHRFLDANSENHRLSWLLACHLAGLRYHPDIMARLQLCL
jgi:hypothetical protein